MGERLRAVYHPNNHGPGHADPSGAIEEFRSVERALEVFRERARHGRSLYYPAATFGPPPYRDWPTTDETAFMDVWVEVPVRGEQPMPPDCMWQRWTLGADGQVCRGNF